jgi:hypothetical protein
LLGSRAIPLDADHNTICKLTSRDQAAYKSVFNFVTNTLLSNPRVTLLENEGAVLEPRFALHEFHTYSDDIYGLPREGPLFPEDLRDAIALTAAFTIASSSPKSIRIQSISFRVIEHTPFELFTFPAYERGGNGISPVVGWTELKPEVGNYPLRTNVKWNVGKGLNPVDFHIRAFSKTGNTFKIAVEIVWMDLDEQEELHRFTFPEEYTVEMPKLTKWEDVVRKAKALRIFSNDAYFILNDLRNMQVTAHPTTIIPVSEEYEDSINGLIVSEGIHDALKGTTVWVPDSDLEELKSLVGIYKHSVEEGQPRDFIIADENLLLIENEERDELSKGIRDKEFIGRTIAVFDDLVRRFKTNNVVP